MNFFTDKIYNIRNTITNVGSTASSTSASFIAPKEKLLCFTTIGREELNNRITASKPTTRLLDPVPTKLLKELPVAEEPLLNIINSSLSLGHVPKPFKLAVIKPLIKKPQLDPSELANYRPISNLPFMLNGKTATLIMSLFVSLFLPRVGITQASVWIQPLNDLRWPNTWEEMMPTPQRTSEDANPQTTYRITKFCHKLNIYI